ncbi:TrbC/VIRB2 family protein [Luteibacter rhizovicinus]|uniref:TrbC/VIRB2 family protein n=1 Tax=Luteibacter rhizovicinus TaxID=242606 RepID=A0A4R3YPE1_9GAMM|nr:TrbC/VirB2 family protein [Luteibacter rhizovicinus]TCV94755.1 TrbC/VIRB2 family protein [Luteibacter rhizovicinus]
MKSPSPYTVFRTATLLTVTAFFAVLCTWPCIALAANDVIGDKSDIAVGWIRTAVKFVLVVAVLGSGLLAAFGRMSWTTVGQVLIGAVIAGTADAIVNGLYSVRAA